MSLDAGSRCSWCKRDVGLKVGRTSFDMDGVLSPPNELDVLSVLLPGKGKGRAATGIKLINSRPFHLWFVKLTFYPRISLPPIPLWPFTDPGCVRALQTCRFDTVACSLAMPAWMASYRCTFPLFARLGTDFGAGLHGWGWCGCEDEEEGEDGGMMICDASLSVTRRMNEELEIRNRRAGTAAKLLMFGGVLGSEDIHPFVK